MGRIHPAISSYVPYDEELVGQPLASVRSHEPINGTPRRPQRVGGGPEHDDLHRRIGLLAVSTRAPGATGAFLA